jgi:DNA polymerase III delta prime subunit
MSPIQYKKHHRKYAEKRLPGTAEWLLKHKKYLDWKSSSVSSILLLHGAPGSGKSSLVSAVIDSFSSFNASNAHTAPFPYFYCSKNAAEIGCSSPREVLRSVLRQLSRADPSRSTIHNAVLAEYEHREADSKLDGLDIEKLNVQECVRLILEISASNPTTIIIDAVDEIDPSERHQLLDALEKITQASQSVVKIFLSSRNDVQILAILKDVSQLRIEATSNRLDIELYVYQSVNDAVANGRLLGGKVNADLQADLTEGLLAFCGEVFVKSVPA